VSTDAETLKVYAANADRYGALATSESEARSLAAFLDRLADGAHVLDLGCGPGHHAAVMMARVFRVSAWDACPEFVADARARGVEAELRSFDDLTGQAVYDAVWASFSLLHAQRADLTRHLAAIGLSLRPGGHLFLGMKTGTGEGRDRLGRFYTYVTRPELEGLVADAGFRVLDVSEDAAPGLAGTTDPYILMTARNA
jgi:SAM-dependent methyltransferase